MKKQIYRNQDAMDKKEFNKPVDHLAKHWITHNLSFQYFSSVHIFVSHVIHIHDDYVNSFLVLIHSEITEKNKNSKLSAFTNSILTTCNLGLG